ncbi:hypothetical protein Hamer_G005246 [Homarus americanus]|uniref:Uncharacterized protein n=1 Tax=Homarus americanus TaxID=6706 RepID=A0A8J5K5I0_HOMAM|nr:hypothetical protein Hamer_G005246 [Homarus americanus]
MFSYRHSGHSWTQRNEQQADVGHYGMKTEESKSDDKDRLTPTYGSLAGTSSRRGAVCNAAELRVGVGLGRPSLVTMPLQPS